MCFELRLFGNYLYIDIRPLLVKAGRHTEQKTSKALTAQQKECEGTNVF